MDRDHTFSALRKTAERIANGELTDLPEDVRLEVLQAVHELDTYRYELGRLEQSLELGEKALQDADRGGQTFFSDQSDMLDWISLGILRLDRHGIIEQANKTAARLLSEPGVSLIGRSFTSFVYPGDYRRYFKAVHKNIRLKENRAFELRLKGPNRGVIHAHLQTEPKHSTVGRKLGWYIFFIDVTLERKQTLQLQEMHHQLEMAAGAAGMGIWNYDLRNDTATWNAELYRMAGLTPRQGPAPAQVLFDFIHPEDRTGIVQRLRSLTKKHENLIKEEFRIVRTDGQIRWLTLQGKVFRDPKGWPVSMSGVTLDITERKEREKMLQQIRQRLADQLDEAERANEELSQYAYAVSHDLRGPLRAIRNYIGFLEEDLAATLSGDQKQYLGGIRNALDQGDELIRDLLSLARIDQVTLETEAVDLGEVVEEIRSLLDIPDGSRIKVASEWPTVHIDRILLKQILHNLIDNGLKFNIRSTKRIEIDWQPAPKDRIDIRVRDNGIGIDPQYHQQVFRIFQRLHTYKEYTGSGIGLAIVQKAVQKAGGTVRVESESGSGSTFYVQLPLKPDSNS